MGLQFDRLDGHHALTLGLQFDNLVVRREAPRKLQNPCCPRVHRCSLLLNRLKEVYLTIHVQGPYLKGHMDGYGFPQGRTSSYDSLGGIIQIMLIIYHELHLQCWTELRSVHTVPYLVLI